MPCLMAFVISQFSFHLFETATDPFVPESSKNTNISMSCAVELALRRGSL